MKMNVLLSKLTLLMFLVGSVGFVSCEREEFDETMEEVADDLQDDGILFDDEDWGDEDWGDDEDFEGEDDDFEDEEECEECDEDEEDDEDYEDEDEDEDDNEDEEDEDEDLI